MEYREKIPTIHTKFMVEEQDGTCNIEDNICPGHLDPENEYLKMRFIHEEKGLRWIPKSIKIHHQRIEWV